MDEFILNFTRHLSSLKVTAFECIATGHHSWIKKRAKRAIINGNQVISVPCQCSTEKRVTQHRDGRRTTAYYYPDGYRREPGCGPRTRELNATGFGLWAQTLPLVDEL